MSAPKATEINHTDERHAAKAAARFDDWADTYGDDRISPWLRFYQRLSISKLGLEPGAVFLDVGCGTGWAVREVARRDECAKACGIDISPKMVEKASREAEGLDNVEFQVANAEQIPYPDEHFDAILCTCSFHHYQNPIAGLTEIKRVLKRGRRFVLLDSARDVSFPIWLQDRGRRYLERSHVRYYTRREIRDLLKQVQFELTADIEGIKKFMDHRKVFTGLMLAQCRK